MRRGIRNTGAKRRRRFGAAWCPLLCASLSLCLCVGTGRADSAWRAEFASEVPRPEGPGIQLSGITWLGGDSYFVVDDDSGCLHPLTLAINRADGTLSTNGIVLGAGIPLTDVSDPEGCAWDTASSTVWVVSEITSTIREHDPSDGTPSRTIPLPSLLRRPRSNFGLESLAISPDGLVMWTANEDTLPADGERGSTTQGALVRLVKFTRDTPRDDWREAGQWAYRVDPVAGDPHPKACGGVAELAILPDGSLLVLERMLTMRRGFPTMEFRLYQADISGATDVSGAASLRDLDATPAAKSLVYRGGAGFANYEAVCLGPTLDDGSRALVLVSDGGGSPLALKTVLTLRLSPIADAP